MHTYIHVHINITYMLFISLGVFMRDVTLCNEGTPKKLRNGLYNFSKLRTLVMMVRFFIHIQLAYLSLYTYTSRPLSCPFLPPSYICHTPFLSISSFFIPIPPLCPFLPPSYMCQTPFLSSYLPSPLSFSTSFLYMPHPLLIDLLFLHTYPSSLSPFVFLYLILPSHASPNLPYLPLPPLNLYFSDLLV